MRPHQAGLYIHVPFCLSKCGYCSFHSTTRTDRIDEYLAALPREMALYSSEFSSFDTLYIGGGTPSLLTIKQLACLLEAVHHHFTIAPQSEITLEINPGDVSADYLRSLRQMGFTRLNIGVQSFDDAILKHLGRRHTANDALSALTLADRAGFDNIGMDLIYGVSGLNMTRWMASLDKALATHPAHLSCYQLSLEADTPLGILYHRKNLALPGDDETLPFFIQTSQRLSQAGYLHYEVSNFARSATTRSRHNSKYWQHIPYLGLGPAAHSFFGNRRWWNYSDLDRYLAALNKPGFPSEGSETLDCEALRLETLFLGMRTQEGIHLADYQNRFGSDLFADHKDQIESWIHQGLLCHDNGRLRPTLAGLALADSLALL